MDSGDVAVTKNGFLATNEKPKKVSRESFEQPPISTAIMTYLAYGLLLILGHISDLLLKLGVKKIGHQEAVKEDVSTAHVRLLWCTRRILPPPPSPLDS